MLGKIGKTKKMLKLILAIFIEKVLELIVKSTKDYLKLRKLKKEDGEKVDEILKSPDRKTAAARMDDVLSS